MRPRSPHAVGRLRATWLATRLALGLALGLALSSSGCGGQDPPATGSAWLRAWVPGLERASAAAVHEESVLLLDGPARRLHAFTLADLQAGAAVIGRDLLIDVQREALLAGHELGVDRGGGLPAQGYRLGTLWDQPLDFVGLCTRRLRSGRRGGDVEAAYLLERAYGVVWSGRLERDAAGRLVALHLESALVVPGRPREGAARLDWRDVGGGLRALAMGEDARAREDLLLLESAPSAGAPCGVQALDRLGQRLGRWPLEVEPVAGVEADLRALAWDGRQHRVLLGPGPGEVRTLPASATSASGSLPAAGAWAAPGLAQVPAFTALACPGPGQVLLAGPQPGGVALAWRVR